MGQGKRGYAAGDRAVSEFVWQKWGSGERRACPVGCDCREGLGDGRPFGASCRDGGEKPIDPSTELRAGFAQERETRRGTEDAGGEGGGAEEPDQARGAGADAGDPAGGEGGGLATAAGGRVRVLPGGGGDGGGAGGPDRGDHLAAVPGGAV